jgi:hypothetical protein
MSSQQNSAMIPTHSTCALIDSWNSVYRLTCLDHALLPAGVDQPFYAIVGLNFFVTNITELFHLEFTKSIEKATDFTAKFEPEERQDFLLFSVFISQFSPAVTLLHNSLRHDLHYRLSAIQEFTMAYEAIEAKLGKTMTELLQLVQATINGHYWSVFFFMTNFFFS